MKVADFGFGVLSASFFASCIVYKCYPNPPKLVVVILGITGMLGAVVCAIPLALHTLRSECEDTF